MLSCTQFLAEFGKHLEGDLPHDLRRELERHLRHCNTCSVIVDSTEKTIRIVTELGQFKLSEPLPEEIVQSVMNRVRAIRKPESVSGDQE